MKKYISAVLAVAIIAAAFSMPAAALDYTFDGQSSGTFAAPTSVEYIIEVPIEAQRSGFDGERSRSGMSELSAAPQAGSEGYGACGDESKNAAYIPPAFGSPTSYTLNSGELLTPNLVTQSNSTATIGVTVVPPTVTVTTSTSPVSFTEYYSYTPAAFTSVTSDLYYSNGSLGSVSIPAIGVTVNIYEGTDSATLAKGAGHFTTSSIWDGNVCLAAHNRGTNNYFGKIHNLTAGNKVTLTTKLGTRSYEVYSVAKISVNDLSALDDTSDNIITLITCVMNEPDYRWCVKAKSD